MRLVHFLCLVALMAVPLHATCKPYVAFRLDDIQDYWLTAAQMRIMDLFKNSDTPLTIGIIANEFGEDSTIVNYVKSILQSDWDVEVANHGWNHEHFWDFTYSEQKTFLSDGRSKTKAALSPYLDDITTFMPPYNKFNDDTVRALKELDYTVLSADTDIYKTSYPTRPYPNLGHSLDEFPIGASTTDPNDDAIKINAAETFDLIKKQISQKGWSAVMMHFVEFTDSNGKVITAYIDDLADLIQMCKDEGYGLTTLKGLHDHADCSSTSDEPPATTGKKPVTTGKQTSAAVTTGKVSAVTTGKAKPATTGKAPATTGKVSQATTGKVSPVTTGKAAPATTGKSDSGTCTLGNMRCAGTSGYQTCTWVTRTDLGWSTPLNCQAGLKCQQSGDYIYCVR